MAARGVSIIVLRPRAVLLIKRGKAPYQGHWSFPGGAIEPGENEEDAARRELCEETGLVAGAMTPLGEFAVAPDPGAFVIQVFSGGYLSGEPVAADDAAAAQFAPFDDVLNRVRTPGLAGWVARALVLRLNG
ncbi:MAG: NUDIX domain-containing protein [Alphaproteobacteria bacterium]